MKTKTIVTIITLASATCLQAHESEQKLEVPGFRPPTELAADFLQKVDAAKVMVYPSIVRIVDPAANTVTTHYDASALKTIAESLKQNRLGTATVATERIDIGETPKGAQFAVFNHTMEVIGNKVKAQDIDADYALVLDIIRVRNRAWGIQCYVLDSKGRNVFSFLMNSHHKCFVDAGIALEDETAEAKTKFIAQCTELAINSLKQQVHQAKAH